MTDPTTMTVAQIDAEAFGLVAILSALATAGKTAADARPQLERLAELKAELERRTP